MARSQPILFEDVFDVVDKDPDGKKFDNVSRFICHSDLYEMDLHLDINTELFPLQRNDKFSLVLAWTLNLDATPGSEKYDADFPAISGRRTGRRTPPHNYDYVMHGPPPKYKDNNMKVEVYVSFGGLLMKLAGDPAKLEPIEVDNNVYLLLKKL
ncbi:DNA-directed RNA polymerases I, II, and III subunit rpabc3 [Tetrabaena socialis]|uniref:DNA-directed RNA polymerases I, II, and III subunit rpabc3 n=1 Tax=Tetrabaena socialis TaxID=47790 RepID=A0A2J7ZVK8_9CHLO|nr:DNA-directed RNA polymerases I, II, and III subunit rpabc3 [Tetrabaena socialis]|eukprot:PNH04302.1 DNA-directed RNA polymerases I, II, and III subunit rpabc3 [Tetrabaena socialis]